MHFIDILFNIISGEPPPPPPPKHVHSCDDQWAKIEIYEA